MEKYRLVNKRSAVIITMISLLLVALSATVKPACAAEEAIDVSCYKKKSEAGLYVGNVSITRPETAAVNCNATYYDCKDKCIGCFTDPKLNQTVCYNAAGEKVPQ